MSGQVVPCVLVGVTGLARPPLADHELTALVYSLAVGVWVHGTNPRDTRVRRDIYAVTVAETILQRTPHQHGIAGLELRDLDLLPADPVSRRYVASARLLVDVTVDPGVLTAGLPRDGTGWDYLEGLAGGPPASPYDPVPPPPQVAGVDLDIVKEPVE